MATVLVIQHLEPEGPGAIAVALRAAGFDLEVHRSDLDGDPPPLGAHAAVVVMGGPMDAHRDEGFPTRPAELALLREAIDVGRPVLGVCLGAQLLAIAAGGSAFPGADGPEIGWLPISTTPEAADDPLLGDVPSEVTVLQWHGDTFSLPPEVPVLARSDRYEHQAFRVGPRAWGFQFHLEVGPLEVERFLTAFAAEAATIPGGVEGLRAGAAEHLPALGPVRDHVLRRFAECVANALLRG